MSRRAKQDYIKVFNALLELAENDGRPHSLRQVMLDFERASWTGLRSLQQDGRLANDVRIVGCFFHYCQVSYHNGFL